MKRLTDKKKWDILYKKTQDSSKWCVPKTNFISKGLRKYFCPYSDYLLWNVIFKKHLPKTEGAKVLEVGSAPGDFLVRLHKTYGFIPYGVEYSESGVVQNKKMFNWHNIEPDNVLYADFFDDKYQQKFKGYFDIVVSRGFIEHFTDVEEVIEKHLNVLAEGGCLIVSIPNLNRRSLYGACASLFHKERLEVHNLDIMSKESFFKLFNRKDLSTLFCDYYGTLRLNLISPGNIFLIRLVLYACRKVQLLLNPILYLLFRDKGAESRVFSPLLLYVGLKKNRETISSAAKSQ